MEPDGSLPHSQVPANCPYPEPALSSPWPQIPLPEHPSYYYPPIYARVSQVVSFPQISLPKPCTNLPSSPYSLHDPPMFLDFITRKILGEQYRSLSSSLCSFLRSHVTSSLLDPNILFSTLFSNTVNLRYSLNVSDQVLHPYKTTGQISALLYSANYSPQFI